MHTSMRISSVVLLFAINACAEPGDQASAQGDGTAGSAAVSAIDMALSLDDRGHDPVASQTEELEEPTSSPAVSALTGYDRCGGGEICFFSEPRGRGRICRWNEFDDDWLSGGTTCSWSRNLNVCSVKNNLSRRVIYYRQAHYVDRIGSTVSMGEGDLACSYRLQSHKLDR